MCGKFHSRCAMRIAEQCSDEATEAPPSGVVEVMINNRTGARAARVIGGSRIIDGVDTVSGAPSEQQRCHFRARKPIRWHFPPTWIRLWLVCRGKHRLIAMGETENSRWNNGGPARELRGVGASSRLQGERRSALAPRLFQPFGQRPAGIGKRGGKWYGMGHDYEGFNCDGGTFFFRKMSQEHGIRRDRLLTPAPVCPGFPFAWLKHPSTPVITGNSQKHEGWYRDSENYLQNGISHFLIQANIQVKTAQR